MIGITENAWKRVKHMPNEAGHNPKTGQVGKNRQKRVKSVVAN